MLNNQLLTIFIASDSSLQATWHLANIEFYPDLMSAEVAQDTRIALFMAAPSISLFFALVAQFIYLSVSLKKSWLSYFLLWWIAHGYSLFFGLFGISPFLSKYQYHISNTLPIPSTVLIVLSAASLFILYKIGENISMAIIIKTGNYSVKSIRDRIIYLTFSIFIPWILGSALIILFFGGWNIVYGYSFISIFVVVLPTLVNSTKQLPTEIKKQKFENHINVYMIALTIALVLIYYYLTRYGLTIQSN